MQVRDGTHLAMGSAAMDNMQVEAACIRLLEAGHLTGAVRVLFCHACMYSCLWRLGTALYPAANLEPAALHHCTCAWGSFFGACRQVHAHRLCHADSKALLKPRADHQQPDSSLTWGLTCHPPHPARALAPGDVHHRMGAFPMGGARRCFSAALHPDRDPVFQPCAQDGWLLLCWQ